MSKGITKEYPMTKVDFATDIVSRQARYACEALFAKAKKGTTHM